MAAGLDEAQQQRRRRIYEFLDSTKPSRGLALRFCETAREMRRIDGYMKEARLLLRSAFGCVKDYASVYRGWIAMEMEGGGDFGVGVARWLFEEWGAVCAKDGSLRNEDDGSTTDEYGDYWCAYLASELRHGNAGRARAVAARAVRACPRDASMRDTLELHLRVRDEQQGRHRQGLIRSGKKWLVDDLPVHINSIAEQCRGSLSLFSRPPRGYQKLRASRRDLLRLDSGVDPIRS